MEDSPMSETAEKLKPLLAALTQEDRAELVEYMRELDDAVEEAGLTEDQWEAAWAEEVNRRIDAARNGQSDSMPHEEFMRRMKEKYG
jgi:putative addiction module component (TIGR02574 family)